MFNRRWSGFSWIGAWTSATVRSRHHSPAATAALSSARVFMIATPVSSVVDAASDTITVSPMIRYVSGIGRPVRPRLRAK